MIEMIVALGLFTIFFAIATGAFTRGLRTQRNIVSLIAASDNASKILEQMVREIRTGTNFSSPEKGRIDFVNQYGNSVTYRLHSQAIERSEAGEDFYPITSSNVQIKFLDFILKGCETGDGLPPRITILLEAVPNIPQIEAKINLQVTVSARNIDT